MIKKIIQFKNKIFYLLFGDLFYNLKHYFLYKFNKKIIKFRNIEKIKTPIFLYENRLKVSQKVFSVAFSGCSIIKIEYLLDEDKDDDFKSVLKRIIEIMEENNTWKRWESKDYKKDSYYHSGYYKKEDIDLACYFDILINLIGLDQYIENPCKHYSIGGFQHDLNTNIISFKIFYACTKLLLKKSDILYHSTDREIDGNLKGYLISNDSILYSSKRLYIGLNMIYDRYGSEIKPSDKKEKEKFLIDGNIIFKISPFKNDIVELYFDPELDLRFNCGYVEIDEIKDFSIIS